MREVYLIPERRRQVKILALYALTAAAVIGGVLWLVNDALSAVG